MIEEHVLLTKNRDEFFKKWQEASLIPLINKLTVDSLRIRLKKVIIALLHRFEVLTIYKSV